MTTLLYDYYFIQFLRTKTSNFFQNGIGFYCDSVEFYGFRGKNLYEKYDERLVMFFEAKCFIRDAFARRTYY